MSLMYVIKSYNSIYPWFLRSIAAKPEVLLSFSSMTLWRSPQVLMIRLSYFNCSNCFVISSFVGPVHYYLVSSVEATVVLFNLVSSVGATSVFYVVSTVEATVSFYFASSLAATVLFNWSLGTYSFTVESIFRKKFN